MTNEERAAGAALSTVATDVPEVRSMVWAMGAQGALARIMETGTTWAERLAGEDPVEVLGRGEEAGLRFVIPGDAEWPDQLAELAVVDPREAPVGLWVRGCADLRALTRRSATVTGSRAATAYGEQVAADAGAALARAGITVVSGGGFGVEHAAVRGAIAGGGKTVVVLPCGADLAYPTAHRGMMDLIAREHGVVVSEVGPGTAPMRRRYEARHRLLAALSEGVVIPEAAARSGSLGVAEWCGKFGHPLLAAPGPITSATSAGVHALIRDGKADLLLAPEDACEVAGLTAEVRQ